MVDTTNNINIKFLVQAAKAQAQVDQFNAKMKQMETRIAAVNKTSARLGNSLVRNLKRGQDAIVGFNGAMLSTLFFGMALKTTMEAALKSIFEGYKKVIPETDSFNKLTTRLTANWEFFKFQLADIVANSPIFIWLIEGIISVIKVFQKMPDWAKFATVALIAIGAVVGGLLLFVSILSLGAAGLVDLAVGVGIFETLDGAIVGLNTSMLKSLGGLLLILAAVAVVVVAIDKYADSSEFAKDKTDKLKDAFLKIVNSVITPLAAGFGSMGVAVKDLGGVIVFFGALFISALVAIGQSFNFFILVIRGAWNIVEIILQLMVNAVIKSALLILDALHKIAIASDFVFGTSFAGGINTAISALESLQFTTNDFIGDFRDLGDAFDNFTTNAGALNEAMVDPIKAVEEYNNELAKLEDQKNSSAFINDLLSADNQSLIPSTTGTTGTTSTSITNILQIDGNTISSDISSSLNNIVDEVKAEIGFEDTFASGQ